MLASREIGPKGRKSKERGHVKAAEGPYQITEKHRDWGRAQTLHKGANNLYGTLSYSSRLRESVPEISRVEALSNARGGAISLGYFIRVASHLVESPSR